MIAVTAVSPLVPLLLIYFYFKHQEKDLTNNERNIGILFMVTFIAWIVVVGLITRNHSISLIYMQVSMLLWATCVIINFNSDKFLAYVEYWKETYEWYKCYLIAVNWLSPFTLSLVMHTHYSNLFVSDINLLRLTSILFCFCWLVVAYHLELVGWYFAAVILSLGAGIFTGMRAKKKEKFLMQLHRQSMIEQGLIE